MADTIVTKGLEGVNSRRLFVGSCLSLISTSVAFAVVGAIMNALKTEFLLTNAQVGLIGGAAIWGFTVSIFVLGPMVDAFGMHRLLNLAALGHFLGPIIMMLAALSGGAAFWVLFFGALIISLANGTVEAVCNPLVATIYPDKKTEKLNQFHVWFPGGIVIGGVLSFLLNKIPGLGAWQLKIALIMLPTVIYFFLFLGQKFPYTERVQSGLSFMDMVKGAFGRPLFWLLLFCMMITASMELGPNRWVPAVLEAGGIAGILVLAYINGLMAVLRYYAGFVVDRLSPTGVLVCSAILGGIGLFWLSFAESTVMAFVSATVFAVGVCYFWPTMLGVTAERVPKGGALALALMGGMGMLIVGAVTAPTMGSVADEYLHEKLEKEPVETVQVLQQVIEKYPAVKAQAPEDFKPEIQKAIDDAAKVVAAYEATQKLPEIDTANALRSGVRAQNSAPDSEVAGQIAEKIQSILLPADNYGGRMSFRLVSPFAIILVVVFGIIYLKDKARGGYRVEAISGE